MFRQRLPLLAALVLSVGVVPFVSAPVQAQTLTKQFTYQGFIENNGVPFTGTAGINFGLFSALTGGTHRDNLTLTNVTVTKGVFSAVVNFGDTDLFGAEIYDGRPLYLQVSADIGSGVVNFTPRQLIQAAPYALSMPNVVTKNGNVGIGSTNPTNTLDITDNETGLLALRGSSGFGSYLSLLNTSAGGDAWAFISTGASNGEGAGKLMIANQLPRLTIDTNGNVGIGTFAPSDKLTVQGSARVNGATVLNGNTKVLGTSTTVGTIRLASDDTANPTRTLDISSGSGVNLISNSDIYMLPRGGRKFLLMNTDADSGNVGIGTPDPTEKLHVNGNIRAKVIIIEGGADLAESYDVAAAGEVKPMPGMVVSIDAEHIGKMRIATSAYDRTVAGIISGADGIAPGLVLGQKGTVADGEYPIANAGRVWCYVDADAGGPVVPGDLLTTSETPGHAMKASDAARASGATMGKAMSKLESGRGLVLVLVTLQ